MKKQEKVSDIDNKNIESLENFLVADKATASLRDLVLHSIKWSEAINAQNKKILRYMRWITFIGNLRFVMIIIPIIIGIIYLPPFFSEVWSQYQSLIGGVSAIPLENESIKILIEQFGSGASTNDLQNFLGRF